MSLFGVSQRAVRARADVGVWCVGQGPAVVLVHGFPDTAVGLLPLARALAARGFACYCPALPGFPGADPVDDDDYSPAAVTRDLVAVLNALDLDQAVYVGHDWGAEIGFHLVSEHAERITAFVSLGVPHPSGYAVRRTVYGELRSAWYALLLAYADAAPEIAREAGFLTALAQEWSPGFHRDDWPRIVAEMQRPGVMEAVCRYYRANLGAPLPFPSITVPTLIVHGGQDGCIGPACHPDFGRFFSAELRQAMLPDVGHWPHLEAPEQTLKLVMDVLALRRS